MGKQNIFKRRKKVDLRVGGQRLGDFSLRPPLPEVLEHLADHLLLGADQQPHHVVPRLIDSLKNRSIDR